MRPAPLRLVIAIASLGCSLGIAGAADAPRVIGVIPVTGPIGPAPADFVQRALDRAETDRVEPVALEIDTPGALDTSMREIVKGVLAAPSTEHGLAGTRGRIPGEKRSSNSQVEG